MNLTIRTSVMLLVMVIIVSTAPLQSIAKVNEIHIEYSADRSSYNITASISGYNESMENVTASLYLKVMPSGFELNADIDALTSNFTSMNITGSGNMSSEQINDTIISETLNKLLIETRVNSSILSMGSSSEEYEMLPLTISIDRLYTKTIQKGLNYTNTSIELDALFNLSKGLNYIQVGSPIPIQGDLALAIKLSVNSVTVNRTIEFSMDLSLESKSGNQAVDVLLITMIKQMLSLYLTEDVLKQMLLSMGIDVEELSLNINISPDDPRVMIMELYFKGKLMDTVSQQPMPGAGQIPSIQPNITGISFTFTPIGESFNSSASWSYNITSYNVSENLYAVNATFRAEGEMSSPIIQGGFVESLVVNASIDRGYYNVELSCSGSGNPLASFNALMSIIKASLEGNLIDTVELNIATREVSLLDTSTTPPKKLEGTIILSRSNMPESIGLAYDDTILSIEDKTLKAVSPSLVEADLPLLASVEKAVIEAPGIIVKSPSPVMAVSDFGLDIVNGDEKVEVNVYKGTVLSGETAFSIAERGVASRYADELGKRVIGTPFEVSGVLNGTLEIGLSLDEEVEPGKVYVLEVKPDGTTNLIQNVEVKDRVVYFKTSEFSMFIPVTDVEETGGVVTTTTTTTEETTETTTTETTEEETTTTTATTTKTTRTTTTTTTEETTTTTSPTKTTTTTRTTETTTETTERTTYTTTTEETTTRTTKTETTTTFTTTTETTEEETTTTTATTTKTTRTTTTTTPPQTTTTTTTEETTTTTSPTKTTETTEEGERNWALIAVATIIIIAIIGAVLFMRR